jgi:hypothetical protein
MQLLDSITVHRLGDTPRKIQLYRGDLTALIPSEAVDVLVVSAFRGDYLPTQRSLIGALHRKKISVAELAKEKAVDLRDYFSCWLSQDLTKLYPDCGFKRLLCFEPATGPHEVVGHLFQALAPFLGGKLQFSTVAMPLLASGDQGFSPKDILPPLIDEAVNWMSLGFPLRCLKIVEHERSRAPGRASPIFAEVKKKHHHWDVFLSDSHQDREEADVLYGELQDRDIKVFRDSQNLQTGCVWGEQILSSVRSSGYFVPLYSQDYIHSDMCIQEHSVALASGKPVLFPICLCNNIDVLPLYMREVQMERCPKGDVECLRAACLRLVARVQG